MKFPKSIENITCQDLIKCVFDLNNLDNEVYKLLKQTGKSTTIELSKKLKKERSTVYRSLQKLILCGLCEKQQKKIKTGGYYYLYNIVEINIAMKKVDACIDSWYSVIKKKILEFNE
ncbi:MAG: TrmB family transcriptional regulator [Candidatus Thermoplasmatota archaeon]|nr:TrmB family transcriptional regulator [Candidatus Thermoplasmatota archaeon]